MRTLQSYLQESNKMGGQIIAPGTHPDDVSTFVFDNICDALQTELRKVYGITDKIFYKINGEYKTKNGVSWSVDFMTKPETTKDKILAVIIPNYSIKASVNFVYNTDSTYILNTITTYVYIMCDGKVVGQLFDGKHVDFDTATFKIKY